MHCVFLLVICSRKANPACKTASNFGEITWLGNRLTQVYINKWLLKLHV